MTIQPINPLIAARKEPVTRDLDEYCAGLNKLNWVRASGSPYFIAQRETEDGKIERFLSRGH